MSTVLGERGFVRLCTAAFFSETAEWMLQVALPLYIYGATGSAASTAVTMVLGLAPAVLLSPAAGVLADRGDRRLVMLLTCAGQAAVALPVLAATRDALFVVYLVMAAQSAIAAVFEPARGALVPELVGAERLPAANGLLGLTANLARLAGAWLGGVLLTAGGLPWLLVGYLIALGCAAVLLVRPFSTTAHRTRPALVSPRAWFAGIIELGGNRWLRPATALLVLVAFAQGMFLVLFVPFVIESLGGSGADVGLLRGVQAVGGLAAGLGLATLGRRVRHVRLLTGATLAFGVSMALIWNGPLVTGSFGVYVVVFAAVGLPGLLAVAALQSVLQTAAPMELTGRLLSGAYAVTAGCNAAGMLLAGALTEMLPLPVLLNAQAGLLVLAGAIGWAGYRGRRAEPVRHQRPARDTPRQRAARGEHPAADAGGLAAGGG